MTWLVEIADDVVENPKPTIVQAAVAMGFLSLGIAMGLFWASVLNPATPGVDIAAERASKTFRRVGWIGMAYFVVCLVGAYLIDER